MAVKLGEHRTLHFGYATVHGDYPNAAGDPEPETPQLLDAGLIAEPILIDEVDVLAFTQAELAALQQTAFAPGVEVYRIEGPHRPKLEIRAKRPCVTSLP